MRNVAEEYLQASDELAPFYAKRPRDLFNASPVPVRWDGALVEELRRRNAELGATAAIPDNAVPIVTGQQPGLFTGPLYTVYKAITALNLARQLESRTGVPHVPVFWVGSDDHDFEEARSALFLGKNHEPFTLRYEPETPVDGRPMFCMPLEPSLHTFVDRAASETAGSEFRGEIAAMLHDSLDRSASLAEWTARLMAYLFRETPLVFFAPHWDAPRRLAASVMAREIEDPLRSTRLLNDAGRQLQAMGFPQQVTKNDDECNFFLLVGERRCKVVFRDGRFVLPEVKQSFSPAEVRERLDREPERFSPNVALRCLVQQRVLGAAAYIAGPGEIAYWAQLRPLFDHFELEMPVVYPRSHAALTGLKLNQLRQKYGFSLSDLEEPPPVLVERALKQTMQSPALDVVREHRSRLTGEAAAMADALVAVDGSVRDMAQGLTKRLGDELDRLERALLLGDETQRRAVEKQVIRLCNSLAPGRKPQERAYTIFSFLFQQGPGLVARLIDELDPESYEVQEVEL